MAEKDDEEEPLRSVALQNAQSILQARRRAEEALRKQSEWLRITLASIGDAVISTDAEGRVTFLNGVAEGLTGWPQAEATGRPLSEVFHIVNERTREPVENPALRALREGTVVGLANHTVLVARDGTERPIDDSAAPMRAEGGTPIGVVLVFRDVSERKRAEEALREAYDLLERRVAERTADLAEVNEALKAEIARHRQTDAARREAVQQLINAKEAERRHIARELHDQMGQHLTALSLGLKVLKDGTADTPESSATRQRLQQLQELADLMGREIHHLALELRPTSLDDLGLQAALGHYIEEWSRRSGVAIDFQSTGLDERRLPSHIETALYRVVQEGLTNVVKHAQARRVSLILQRSSDQVLAIVEDDGCGFDAEAAISTRGPRGRLGLVGMRERVTLVGGTLTIESTAGRGTTLFVRIPLSADGEEASDGE